MGWTLEYWTGSSWEVKGDAVVDYIEQELNGHEQAAFTLLNTEANRSWVSQDRRVRMKFNGSILFTGLMAAVVYRLDRITCIVYNECFEKMKWSVFTGSYTNTAANTILQAVCTAAGVTAGQCPTNQVSVRFKRAACYDAACFLASVCQKDFWSDYDGSNNPRFNIGDRVNTQPYPSITPIEWPEREIDRAKKRDKVIIRGVDEQGNYIEGSAGTGSKIAVFSERKASSVSSLNALAAAKLAELNRESSGVTLPVIITASYSLNPGDYVALNNPLLGLVGNYRTFRIRKEVDRAELEVDRAEALLERLFQDMGSLEELGIYPGVEAEASDSDSSVNASDSDSVANNYDLDSAAGSSDVDVVWDASDSDLAANFSDGDSAAYMWDSDSAAYQADSDSAGSTSDSDSNASNSDSDSNVESGEHDHALPAVYPGYVVTGLQWNEGLGGYIITNYSGPHTLPRDFVTIKAGKHTHSVDSPTHGHSITSPSHGHSISSPTHSHSISSPEHSHSISSPQHSHSINSPDHDHSLESQTHTHSVSSPEHGHNVSSPVHGHTVNSPTHKHVQP